MFWWEFLYGFCAGFFQCSVRVFACVAVWWNDREEEGDKETHETREFRSIFLWDISLYVIFAVSLFAWLSWII